MELAISEFKNNPRFLNDFEEIKKTLEGADAEEKVEDWLNELPCHLHIFYNTLIDLLWNINWPRYTTALGATGKESPRSKN